jgi:hypothetical protein
VRIWCALAKNSVFHGVFDVTEPILSPVRLPVPPFGPDSHGFYAMKNDPSRGMRTGAFLLSTFVTKSAVPAARSASLSAGERPRKETSRMPRAWVPPFGRPVAGQGDSSIKRNRSASFRQIFAGGQNYRDDVLAGRAGLEFGSEPSKPPWVARPIEIPFKPTFD